jgi:hypothetical protein
VMIKITHPVCPPVLSALGQQGGTIHWSQHFMDLRGLQDSMVGLTPCHLGAWGSPSSHFALL